MCICYRNWQANDCSERTCQFGLAHVDSPKGDLDMSSGALSGPGVNVVPNDQMYPYGTTEQYPDMIDSALNVLSNTGHAYMECSNKGLCDRTAGVCACFDGYDGSACQRTSCPATSAGTCSGHGVCESISQIATADYSNVYTLWDKDVSMGCVCDSGFTGADCSEKLCKVGADPLYHDDMANVRYSNWTYNIYTTSPTALAAYLAATVPSPFVNPIVGNYSLLFTDSKSKQWTTGAIQITDTCLNIISALEALPNNVIPINTVRCVSALNPTAGQAGQNKYNTIYDPANMLIVAKFMLAFPANVGKLAQLDLNLNLDGHRPTLYNMQDTAATGSTVGYAVYPNGYTGEDTDYVNDYCSGVLVSLARNMLSSTNTYDTLVPQTAAQAKLFKTCLGASDGNVANNIEVYNWDYGSSNSAGYFLNPHLVKLIDATQDIQDTSVLSKFINVPNFYENPALRPFPITNLCNGTISTPRCSNIDPPGFFIVMFYDGTNFNIFNRAAYDYNATTLFHVYTTTGYLQLVNPYANAVTVNSAVVASGK